MSLLSGPQFTRWTSSPYCFRLHGSHTLPPEMSGRPQGIINQRLLKECDLLIAAFWTRIGSPAGVAASGTVEEIEEHLAAGKEAMIYFLKRSSTA